MRLQMTDVRLVKEEADKILLKLLRQADTEKDVFLDLINSQK